jgi:tRNA (Uracil-5-)-methyltransferase
VLCSLLHRAGLDDETVQLLKHFPAVVYISCNPNTLVANLREVKDTHEIRCRARCSVAQMVWELITACSPFAHPA